MARGRLISLLGAILALLTLFPSGASLGQGPEACPVLVSEALDLVQTACETLGRNEACYGNRAVAADTPAGDPLAGFAAPGDRGDLLQIGTLRTAPLDMTAGEWGVAVLSLQANLSETLPGQAVTFVVVGDVDLEAGADAEFPFQAFALRTGLGAPECDEAPGNGLLVQAPQHAVVQFSVNEVEVSLGSTAWLTTDANGVLTIGTLDGLVAVRQPGEPGTRLLWPGYRLHVPPRQTPSQPEPYDNAVMGRLPVQLLPHPVTPPVVIPAGSGWIDTGLALEAGQSIVIQTAGRMDLWPNCETQKDEVGLPDANCPTWELSPAGGIGPADSGYPVPGAPVAAVVGRVGDGAPFLIGTGGTFTSPGNGTLQVRINDLDEYMTDDAGAFVVTFPARG
jgi:hypothetical protein